MRLNTVFLLVMGLGLWVPPASPRQEQQPPAPTPSAVPQTEIIGAPKSPPATQAPESGEAGYMEPAQVQTLLYKVWLQEFRINDLLTAANPERWKLDVAAAGFFNQHVETIHAQLSRLEDWRSQFEKRTESMYLAYQTDAAMASVLSPLGAVVQAVAQHDNSSFAAQYSQAEGELSNAQQTIEAYLRYLLRNQDQLVRASESNLAACQNQLGYAMHASAARAKPMKNEHFVRPERLRARRGASAAHPAATGQKAARKAQPQAGNAKKSEPNPAPRKP